MLRLRFGVDDLARTTFAAPYLLCEVSGSIEAVQRPASGFRRRCRSGNTRLPGPARSLLGLVPVDAGVPEFLAPERTGSLDELLDVVLSTPAARVATDLSAVHAGRRPSPWVRELASGDAQAARDLGDALRSWHDQVVAPHWTGLQQAVAAELSRRAWQLTTRGAEETLNTLHPTIRWRDGELQVPSPDTADVDLAGRGLRLVPSAVWTRPVLALGWEQPSLTYPIVDGQQGPGERGRDDADELGALIGSTRAQVLRAVAADGERSTSGLAAGLGVGVPSVSYHVSVLREAGLLASRRHGREVRHGLTELGHRLASGAGAVRAR